MEFVDLPATCLALAGRTLPASLDGRPFLRPDGGAPAPARKYVHAARDYMDETYDRIRSVRDERWRYVRNYHPELPWAARIEYMERGQTMQVWRRRMAEGKLNSVQSAFFAPIKPNEELYDTANDPYELRNLAGEPAQAAKLAELRAECDRWVAATGDKGSIPLETLIAEGVIYPRKEEYAERLQRGKSEAK